jgi:hypothetical protein
MPDIRYQFIAAGHETVRAAVKGIGEETKNADRIADEVFRRGRTRDRETARGQAQRADHTKRLAEQVAKDQEKAQKSVAGNKERHFRDEARREEQANRKQERETVQAEARKQRALASGIVTRRKEIAKEVADRRGHEDKLANITRSAAEKRAENERKHQARLADIRRNSEKRLADITARAKDATAARASARTFDRELTQKQRAYDLDKKRKELSDKSRDELRAGIGGALKGAVLGGAVAAGALGAGITGAAARDAIRLQEVANRISISARGAGEEAVDPTVLRREFQQTAIKTPGVSSVDIAEAVAQFVSKTGNLDVARKSQGVFATVASATGSQVQDVAAAAADLFQKFDINTVEGMADAMSALAFQGKAGAFELKDAASQFAKLSAAASRFGLDKGAGGVRVLGGLTQIARTATGSPEQAATAVEAMFRQFTSREATKQLRQIGVNPFKDKKGTQTKDVRDLIVETITKSGGNLTKLQGIFGDEGIRAISPIISAFNEAERAKKGTGEKAARGFIDQAINAPGDFAELQKDALQAQQDASAKLAATWEKLSAGVGEKLIPVFSDLVDRVADSPDAIDAFIGTIEILAHAIEGAVLLLEDFAEMLGISVKKKKSPEQIREEERKKAIDLQKQIDRESTESKKKVIDLTRAGKFEEAKRVERESAEKIIDLTVRQRIASTKTVEADKEVKKVQDQQGRVRGTAEFAAEYAKLLGPEEYEGQNLQRAEQVGRALRDVTLKGTPFTAEGAMRNETEEARQLRVNQAQARRETLGNLGVKEQTGGTQSDIATKGGMELIQAAAKLAAAAAKLEGAAKAGTPSILGPP